MSRFGRWIGLRWLGRASAWRGADGQGFPVWGWLVALAFVWALARLFRPLEPALLLLPPMLSLSIGIPCLQTLVFRANARLSVRSVTRIARSEMPLAMVLFAVIGWSIFGSMWRDGMLIDSGDHQFIMGRAELFYEGLRQGRWQHWTHLWQGGDSLTDFYPILANLMTALVHALMPRGTPFVVSYTAFVLWAWWLRGVGVYSLARRFSSPEIAFVLALSSLLDLGSIYSNGWFAALFYGMVHSSLALTFGLFATALQVDLTRKVTSARFVLCAVLVALSACGHPLGTLVMVLSTFTLGLAILMGKGPHREGLWALSASSLGLALAAIWVLPFSYVMKLLYFRVAMAGHTYSELGKGLLDGTLPGSSLGAFLGLAIVAAAGASLAIELPIASAGMASLLLMILVLTQFLVGSRFLDYFSSFLDGQPPRMLGLFGTAVIPCVAWMAQGIYGRIPAPSRSLRFARVMRRTVLLGIFSYGLVRALAGGIDKLVTDLRAQVPHKTRTTERSHTGSDYRQVFDWLAQRRREDASPIPWRAAVLWKKAWRHATWTEGMNTGVPIVDPNLIPANYFTIRPREISARGFNEWNIRFAVTDYDGAPFPSSVERFSAGRFHIWEVEPFDQRYVIAPPGVRISELHLEGESIRFRVAGAPPDGVELQLRTAAFLRWRAREDGEWLQVSARPPRPDSKPKQEQLVVRAHDGVVLLTCDGTLPRYWLGLSVSLGAAIALVLTARRERRRKLERLLEGVRRKLTAAVSATLGRVSTRQMRWIIAGGVAVLCGAGSVVTLRGARRLFPVTLEGMSELTVRWKAPDGHVESCRPVLWTAQYVCGVDAAVVDNWLGTTSNGDDSGEWAAQWPGTRVAIHTGGSSVILGFGRVRLDAPAGLWVQTSGFGIQNLKVLWGDQVLANRSIGGEEIQHLALGAGRGGTEVLTIEIEGKDGAALVLQGGAEPAPSLR